MLPAVEISEPAVCARIETGNTLKLTEEKNQPASQGTTQDCREYLNIRLRNSGFRAT